METTLYLVPDINGKRWVNLEPLIIKNNLAKWQFKDHLKTNGLDYRPNHPRFINIIEAAGFWVDENHVKTIVDNLEWPIDYTLELKESFIKPTPLKWIQKVITKDGKDFVNIESVRIEYRTESDKVNVFLLENSIENFRDENGWWILKEYEGLRKMYLLFSWAFDRLTRF